MLERAFGRVRSRVVADAGDWRASSSRQIDVLCGVVSLVALLSSYTCNYDKLVGHTPNLAFRCDLGYLSLQIFFAIAAYQLLREVSVHRDWKRYVVARFARFLPAVVPAVLGTYALLTQACVPQLHADVVALLANLSMAADFVGMPDFDGAFWRLKVEVMFAAGLGVVWFGLGPRLALGVLVVGLACCAFQAHGDPVHERILSASGLLTMDGYLPNFALGIAVFHLAESRRRLMWWLLAGVSAAIILASNTAGHGFVVLLGCGAVGAAAHGALPIPAPLGWLACIGRAFFPIYLVHQALGFVLIHAMETRGVAPFVAVMAACVSAVLCGAALRYAIQNAHRTLQILRSTQAKSVFALSASEGLEMPVELA